MRSAPLGPRGQVPSGGRAEVSRTAGWIAPVVVAAGRVVGVWDVDKAEVDVHLFEESGPIPTVALDAAVERMQAVLAAVST